MSGPYLKDPAAVADYGLNWSEWLGEDTISSSTWTVPTGITKDSQSNTTTAAYVWLSGGTHGQEYVVVNHIVTAAGRTEERSIKIIVRNR